MHLSIPGSLHAGDVFEKADMTSGIPIWEVKDDLDHEKRMVLGGFNAQCAVMRKVMPYDIHCNDEGDMMKVWSYLSFAMRWYCLMN